MASGNHDGIEDIDLSFVYEESFEEKSNDEVAFCENQESTVDPGRATLVEKLEKGDLRQIGCQKQDDQDED